MINSAIMHHPMSRLVNAVSCALLTLITVLTPMSALTVRGNTYTVPCFRIVEVNVDSILQSIEVPQAVREHYDMVSPLFNAPLVYSGYRQLQQPKSVLVMPRFEMLWHEPQQCVLPDSLLSEEADPKEAHRVMEILLEEARLKAEEAGRDAEEANRAAASADPLPAWFRIALQEERIRHDVRYRYMLANPSGIDYASWDVPEPPRLPEEDYSYIAFLESLDLPEVDVEAAVLPEIVQLRHNWLHKFSTGIHLSQAYVSTNWYQGGNSYLSLLFDFAWDVNLNQVFYPKLLFNSSLSYKLAVNSAPKGSLHKFSISQDQFQYNLKTGIKAWEKWFYSLTMQFKTQLFNAYPTDSPDLSASFLSPADFNLGLGMTYSLKALQERLDLSVSISPVSYNLKTCISDRIDHKQFDIDPLKTTRSEIGSNVEANLTWKIWNNISWKSRLFLFTNYKNFTADWENTFNFQITRFLSTQLYVYPRFDSTSDFNATRWHHWMLKEILSIGITYTFATGG